ncbi:VOC family protein [Streptomyces bambusae]|uniref:VOC family protein n=1 Tax=Streptomyces bambusae TaxID=1550616 RepID=UPI001CFF74A9|nr:VOC family protein [Streptomyces bambusae]MCB5169242.1 VOC family protein [Streptomyces bambusae]
MRGPYRPGTPCWVDLMVGDQQAALDFYGGLFGWQAEVGPPEQAGYSVCRLAGQPVAGIMGAINADGTPMDPVPPAAWTTYFATEDAAAAVAAGGAAGGQTVVETMDVMDLGKMAVLADPTGAVFGVWEPGTFPGAGVVNEDNAVIWNELATTDTKAAAAYYEAVVPVTGRPSEIPGVTGYTELVVNGRAVAGVMGLDQHPTGTPPHWMTYFHVDDVDRVQAAAKQAGGRVLAPAFEMPVGRMAVLADPQGAVFAVIRSVEDPQEPDPA